MQSFRQGAAMASGRFRDFDLCEACWKPKVPNAGESLKTSHNNVNQFKQ
jgi:hypothetical protein